MRYIDQPLNSQQVQTLLGNSRLQVLTPTSGDPAEPRATYAADLPARSQASNEYLSVFIQQAQVGSQPAPLNVFSLSVLSCGASSDCLSVRSQAARNAQNVASQRMPLDGMGVSAVYFGDADLDGLTDLLVRFSNGSGALYRAETRDQSLAEISPSGTFPETSTTPSGGIDAGLPASPSTSGGIDAGLPPSSRDSAENIDTVDAVGIMLIWYYLSESIYNIFQDNAD